MKDKTPHNCIFCGSQISGSHPNERIHIHRWVKASHNNSKREKTTVDLPTCALCHKKFHPYSKVLFRFAAGTSIIAVICVLFSFIQRDIFSVSLFDGIIWFVFCAGGAALFTYFGYILAFKLFDDAFTASVKVKPYNDLPIVKYVIENGFVDENDEKYKIIRVEDEGFVSFLEFRNVLKNKYQVK